MSVGTPTTALALEGFASPGTGVTTVGSMTPVANRLYLAAIVNVGAGGGAVPSAVTGGGMPLWAQVASQLIGTNERLSIFRALDSSPGGTAALSVSWGSSQSGPALVAVIEVSSTLLTGSAGADAVVQTAANSTASGSALTCTLSSAFADAVNNMAIGFFASGFTNNHVAGSGFSPALNGQAQSRRLSCEYRLGEDLTVDMTTPGSGRIVGIALEIASGAAGGGAAPRTMYLNRRRAA